MNTHLLRFMPLKVVWHPWVIIVLSLIWASDAQAQIAPFRVKVTRVGGAEHTKVLEYESDTMETSASRSVKLHLELSNLTNKPLEEIQVQWSLVVGLGEDGRKFIDGEKIVELKPLGKTEFDTDAAATTQVRVDGRTLPNQGLRGHWVKVTYADKTVFEEFNPQTIKKYIEQRAKAETKGKSDGASEGK